MFDVPADGARLCAENNGDIVVAFALKSRRGLQLLAASASTKQMLSRWAYRGGLEDAPSL
jgi:hypothetical protein